MRGPGLDCRFRGRSFDPWMTATDILEEVVNYILLIYANEAEWTVHSDEQREAVMREHEQLERDLRNAGQYRGCGGLEPTAAATSLRVRDGKAVVTDGPFVETKEQLGGYYVIEAKDLYEAIAIASRIPTTAEGGVEIRPVADLRL
jgi:hypothetical protein